MAVSEQEQLDQNIKENWLASVGVRKPYTVFVCIMAIIILGIFAFSSMQVDLFPNMNLPYAVVAVTPDTSYLYRELAADGEDIAKFGTEAEAGSRLLDVTADRVTREETAALQAQFKANGTSVADQAVELAALKSELAGWKSAVAGKLETPGTAAAEIATLKSAGNKIAEQFLDNLDAINKIQTDNVADGTPEKIEEEMGNYLMSLRMPDLSMLDNLSKTVLSKLSTVNGVVKTRTTAITSVGTVMVFMEYDSDATVETADIMNALFSLELKDKDSYGVEYAQPMILKIDPSLLPVMGITVSYKGSTDNKEINGWLYKNVLNKIENTVGVGQISTNIANPNSTNLSKDQAWEGKGDNFKTTFSISVNKSSNAITTEVAANVIETLQKLKSEHPDFDYSITSNQGEFINQSIGSVGENLVVGGILALIILFLFLRSIKMTLAIGISIPLALVGTFVFMYFMGINLNIISMAGLALSVGMLVDNSVVVLENIFRLRSKGMPLKEACMKGASQIMMAMLASSLTTICVFFPMFFLKGLIMSIFTDLVWVVILSLLCSFVVAVMFLPSIVATFKINPKAVKELPAGKQPFWWARCKTKADHIFDKTLRFCINKKWWTVAVALVIFIGSAALMLINGFILLPSTDEGTFSVTAPLNAAGQDADHEILAKDMYEQIADILGSDLDKCVVEYSSGQDTSSIISGQMYASIKVNVVLKSNHKISTDKASDKVYEFLKTYQPNGTDYYDNEAIEVSSSSMLSSLVASEVSMFIACNNEDINGAMHDLIAFGTKVDNAFTPEMRNSLGIKKITGYETLSSQIVKYNGKNGMTLTVKAKSDADTNKIQSELNSIVKKLMKEDGNDNFSIVNGGMEEQMNESYQSMGLALIVGFLLIYLVMVAIFQSFLMPLIILICVPLGFTGAFLLLAICQMPLSIPALIGFLILMGVVINNGILAVDYTNQARRDGLSVKEALVAAMHTRMRPIFMTALTTILAMVPMAFGWSLFNPGGSSALMQPLAVVSIGGLLFGTVTTLLVVPAFYSIFCRDKRQKQVALAVVEVPVNAAADNVIANEPTAKVTAPKNTAKQTAKKTTKPAK